MNTFDPATHRYTIDARPVPSVTQMLQVVLPGSIWQAGEWYLDRGQAVHACAAMIARGAVFRHDPAIDGQVRACRKFFREIKPDVIAIEQQVYSAAYMYAGTFDLMATIDKRVVLVDWKSALSPVAEIQLGGYVLACHAPRPRFGMVVALGEDGNYKTGGIVKLERRCNEFMAVRSVYGIMERLGLNKEEADGI